jgi:segregation and condensation protein B
MADELAGDFGDDRHDGADDTSERIAEFKRAIEAIVLVAHDPVPAELLAQLFEEPTVVVEQWCEELAESYVAAGHGFALVQIAGGWRFQTADDLTPYVERFLLHDQRARLSGAALETLAIVAYKQPISRGQVASIRGVDPDGVLRTLQARGYIDEVGRDQGPGQAILYGTTRHLPREARPGVARRPAADRRVHPERGGRRGAGDRFASHTADRRVDRRRSRAAVGRRCARRSHAVSDRPPEPPLWEQMAQRSAELPQGERLQKVLAATGYGSRRCART